MKTQMLVMMLLMAFSFSVSADKLNPAASFDEVDSDGDKSISMSEANDRDDLKKNFSKIDTNRDGKLDVSEFSAFEAEGKFAVPDTEDPEPGAAPF